MGKNLKVGVEVFTAFGGAGVITVINDDKVTIKCNIFETEFEIEAANVSRNVNEAWGVNRAI